MKIKPSAFLVSLALILASLPESASAKVSHILPKPQSVTLTEGVQFALGRPIHIDDPTECELLTDFFSKYNCETSESGATVTVRLVESIDGTYDYTLADYPNEAYTLSVTADAISITAVTPTGVIRAAQTLAQMAEGYATGNESLEGVTITDYPAFKLRGYMHDVGRSFIEIDELIHEIELLSQFKVNTFHWHLTENQAWRFEVKSYPVLTQSDKMTRFAGKYYTQDDCRRLMAVAKKHGVTVIPEIDMPGHSEAFERAMGFAMQTTQGKEVLKTVLEEVANVFADAPYIHIGADEKTITDNTFLPTMTSKIHSLGKKAVCWNPISGVTINPSLGFDMTQMWSSSGKLISGMPNIDCRYNYSNHFDVFADIVGIYKSNIYYAEKGNEEIAGAITAPWNDRKTPTQTDILAQNNFYATVLATVERAWMGGGRQYIEQGGTTLPNSGEEYDEFADWERRFLFHKSHSLKNEPIPYVKQTNVRWKITDPFPNNGNINAVFPPEQQEPADQYSYNNSTYGTATATGAGIYLRHTWASVIPTFYASDPGYNKTTYAYTYVYSPEARTAGALIEFQNYGRSEKDAAPPTGTWDHKGSKVWLNNQEILPPIWDNTGVTITNEVDLRNENFTAREPMQVQLQQGWNKVLIKLPYIQLNSSIVRLNKWLFTFVLTDPTGKEALDDLVYSPSKSLSPEYDLLTALISEIRDFIESSCKDMVGYYAHTEAADELLAKVTEAEAGFNGDSPAEDILRELTALNAEFSTFKTACQNAGIMLPTNGRYYYMYTPLRDSRYLASNGVNAGATGISGQTEQSAWMFRLRNDGSYDIVNYDDNSYLSPSAANNSQISTSSTRPSVGWTIKPADALGYVIITSGTVQINQTQSGLGYKIYNWGDGTNISDSGCKYVFREATDLNETAIPPEPVLTVKDITLNGEAPYKVPDPLAAPVLSSTEATSVAIDYTLASAGNTTAFTAATNTAVSNRFFSMALPYDHTGFGIRYYGLNNLEGWWTQSADMSGAHKIVLVCDPASGFRYYLDGTNIRTVATQSLGEYGFVHFGNVENANALYIGGIVTSDNANKYPFTGQMKSVRFWNKALTARQVSNLEWDNLTETSAIDCIGNDTETAPAKYYNLQGIEIKNPTNGIYIVKQGEKVEKILIR